MEKNIEQWPVELQKTFERKNKKRRRRAAKRNRERALHMSKGYVAFLSACVVVVALSAVSLIQIQSQVTQRMEHIAALESQITDLKADNDARYKAIVTSVDLDYIKNVASSEIYATWPDATIRANVLAIMSFTLNRVYTEWYRGKGKNFTITSSTAFDQKFVYGRNTFTSIANVVNEMFENYLSRPNVRQPILTQDCDGQRVSCPRWLSQWGSKQLGDQGYSAIEILRYYYGSNMYINTADAISGIPASWPGYDLSTGSSGSKVLQLQQQLNRIAQNYPAIPKIPAIDGIFGSRTEASVRALQQIFGLTADGIVGPQTWYEIVRLYGGVNALSELRSQGQQFYNINW